MTRVTTTLGDDIIVTQTIDQIIFLQLKIDFKRLTTADGQEICINLRHIVSLTPVGNGN